MAKIEAAIKDAVTRGARRHVRQATGPLRREVRRLRAILRQLRVDVTALREAAASWKRAAGAKAWQPEVSEEEAKAARLSPRLIRALRDRLALSQAALARLVGVSAAAVVQWERGRSTPAGPNRGALVALRKLGRRDVKRLLASAPKARPVKQTPRRRRRSRPARPRTRRTRK